MTNYDETAAAMIAMSIANPIDRFIESLSDTDVRQRAVETVRLRDEFVVNVQSLLTCSEPREAMMRAEWIRKNVEEISWRWLYFKKDVEWWSTLHAEPVTFRSSSSDDTTPR